MGRRAGKTAAHTRHELLTTALQLVFERGYDGVRVSEIARAAGLSTGAIYSQFASKEELLLAAMTEQAPRIIAKHLASGAQGPVLDLFEELGRALPQRSEVIGRLMLEIITTAAREPTLSEVVSHEFRTNELVMTDGIRVGQANGEIADTLDAETLTRFLHTVALGSLVAATLGLPSPDPAAWANVLTRVLDALRADPT